MTVEIKGGLLINCNGYLTPNVLGIEDKGISIGGVIVGIVIGTLYLRRVGLDL